MSLPITQYAVRNTQRSLEIGDRSITDPATIQLAAPVHAVDEMNKRSPVSRVDLAAGVMLLVLPALFYPLAAARRGVFYVGDIFRLYYPLRAVYATALREGHLPLWSPDILAGYPLLAEGQTGVFYPLNLLLYRFLPIDLALNSSILLSLSLAGLAMYILARVLRLGPVAAFLAGLTFAYSGFLVAHVNHLNILNAAVWLPAQLAFVELLFRRGTQHGEISNPKSQSDSSGFGTWFMGSGHFEHRLRPESRRRLWSGFMALTIALQFTAGHPQISLMSILVVIAYGLFRAHWPWTDIRRSPGQGLRLLLAVLAPVGGGLALAAVQLLPTWELVGQSVRAGGLSTDFFTSFSWHPALLVTLVVPFALGNPYPKVSVELAAYLGLLPLLLALLAVVIQRGRLTLFFAGLALVSLILAFGDYTPFYAPLSRIPILNLFRVPARFLYPFTLAMALLAGFALDALLSRLHCVSESSRGVVSWPGIVFASWSIAFCAILAISAISLEALLALRWVLPPLTLVLCALLLSLAWRRRLGRPTVAGLALALTLVDLYAHNAVYSRTYNDVLPLKEFYARPASLDFFPAETFNYRTLTHEQIVPALTVMRASLYPNISLLHGIPSANGYFPLLPARHARYLKGMTPGRLNLLNGRYFLIPQLLPVDAEAEAYDLANPFAPNLAGRSIVIPPTPAAALVVDSYTSHSAGWPQGEPVADIVLHGQDGLTVQLTLRAGMDTAEWAYDRPDVVEGIAHRRPEVARTWPARSGFPPQAHAGHSYRARFDLPATMNVVGVEVQPTHPRAFVWIEDLAFIGPAGLMTSVRRLVGEGDQRLVYRDPEVAIYENRDALPRVFVVPRARVVPDDEMALSMIDNPGFDPRREVLLAEPFPAEEELPLAGAEMTVPVASSGEAWAGDAQITLYTPQRVVIEARTSASGYLVFLDSFYPGWRASVDGRSVSIQRADALFRAVPLPAGQHTVEFVYAPTSLQSGFLVSLAALVGLAGFMARIQS